MMIQTQSSRTGKVRKQRGIANSYTCPRCRASSDAIGCAECGWTPDTSVAFGGFEMLQEGRLVNC